MTGTTTGWKVTGLVSSALSWTLGGVFWQQPCDAGIPICPHWFFIMWQQARSWVLISALGTMQAIAGARHDARSKTSTPNWRRTGISLLRLRLPAVRSKQRVSTVMSRLQGFCSTSLGMRFSVKDNFACGRGPGGARRTMSRIGGESLPAHSS